MCALEDRLSSQIDPNCQLYRMTTRDATMWLQRSLFGGLGALCVKMGFTWTFSTFHATAELKLHIKFWVILIKF